MPNIINDQSIEETEVTYKQVIIYYGILAGIVNILIELITYLLEIEDSNNIITYTKELILIGIIVIAIRSHRNDDLQGYISFNRAFIVGISCTLISSIIVSIWTYFFISFIAPETIDVVDTVISNATESMEEGGASSDDIEQRVSFLQTILNPVTPLTPQLS